MQRQLRNKSTGCRALPKDLVDQKARFEIICAIQNQIETVEKIVGVLRREVGDDTFHLNAAIHRAQMGLRRHSFRERRFGVRLVK